MSNHAKSTASEVLLRDSPGVESDRHRRFADRNQVMSLGSTAFERWCLARLLKTLGSPPVTVVLWDGSRISGSSREEFQIRICSRTALWRIARTPLFQFPECYIHGEVEISGNIVEFLKALFYALRRSYRRLSAGVVWPRAAFHSGTQRIARANARRHYDLGNDFFKLWLDEQMLYTCAYFETPAQSLEAAQFAKMEYICRKLCLQSGERVVEAGCGWGALALHMARYHDVDVVAYNVSHAQLEYARGRARQENMTKRVTFVDGDWREIQGRFDVFVSVGMLEHVGPHHFHQLGQVIDQCLTEHGRGLIHTIGLNWERALDRWTCSRIFPGAQPPTLQQAMKIFEPFDMNIMDVENLQQHYAQTLQCWLNRFEQTKAIVSEMYDAEFVRMWRFYLASSLASFETGWLQLYQILFERAHGSQFPVTRHHLYPLDPIAGPSSAIQFRSESDARQPLDEQPS